MGKRAPVLLTENTHKTLKRLAFENKVAISKLIRQAVDDYISQKKYKKINFGEPPSNAKRIQVTFEDEMLDKLDRISFESNAARTEHIRVAIDLYLNNLDKIK